MVSLWSGVVQATFITFREFVHSFAGVLTKLGELTSSQRGYRVGFDMGVEFKCAYCDAPVEKNATLVHSEREPLIWDLDYCICPGCFKQFKVMLDKAKSQKSWTGWADKEKEVNSLKKEAEFLKSELQFLRQGDPICDRLIIHDPYNEVVTVFVNGCDPIKAHRSILISRSEVFKKVITSEAYNMTLQDDRNKRRGHIEPRIELTIPMHPDCFMAFIQFLYTAELKPEALKEHASELMTAGNVYEIPILKRRCEEYIVSNMTPENAIAYLKVADQCGSTAITEAAVKQMQNNPSGVVISEEFETLSKTHPAALASAFKYIMLRPAKTTKKEPAPEKTETAKEKVVTPDSETATAARYVAGESSSTFRSLGMCTCAVHPFAHPGYEYHGVHFHTAFPRPSPVKYVEIPAVEKKEP
jgi:hypothetical protein